MRKWWEELLTSDRTRKLRKRKSITVIFIGELGYQQPSNTIYPILARSTHVIIIHSVAVLLCWYNKTCFGRSMLIAIATTAVIVVEMWKIAKGINVNNNNVTDINISQPNKVDLQHFYGFIDHCVSEYLRVFTFHGMCVHVRVCVCHPFLVYISYPLPKFHIYWRFRQPFHIIKLSFRFVQRFRSGYGSAVVVFTLISLWQNDKSKNISFWTYLFVHLHIKAIRHFIVLWNW